MKALKNKKEIIEKSIESIKKLKSDSDND